MLSIDARAHFGPPAASFEALRQSLAVARPASMLHMASLFGSDLVFDQPLVTSDGVALGGHQNLTIRRDGSFRFTGHFRATGLPSYEVSLVTTLNFTVPAPDGFPPAPISVAFVARGEVHGTVEPGEREYRWDQTGSLPLVKAQWAFARNGQFARKLEFDADWLGPAGDVVGFLAQLVAFGATFGAAGVAIVIAGEAADQLDIEQVVLPGIVGVIAAGAAGFVFGPMAMFPAFVLGAAVTAATVKQRHLTAEERAFADKVFRGKIPYDRVLLTNLVGVGNRPFTVPGPGGVILVNMGSGYDDPMGHTGAGGERLGIRAKGQLFIHELTHAWQIANESFTPQLYCKALVTAGGTAGGNMSAYNYGAPTSGWSSFGTEQQGSIVDEWFAGNAVPAGISSLQRSYPPMHADDVSPNQNPYFRYIRDNIWTGIAS